MKQLTHRQAGMMARQIPFDSSGTVLEEIFPDVLYGLQRTAEKQVRRIERRNNPASPWYRGTMYGSV